MGPLPPHGKPQGANGSQGSPGRPTGRQPGHPTANSSPPGMDKHPFRTEFHSAWPQIFLSWRNHQLVLKLPGTSVSRAPLWPAQDPLEDVWASSAHAGGGGLVRNAPSLRLAAFLMAGITCRKESGGVLRGGRKSPGRSTSFQSCISLCTANSAATPSCRSGKWMLQSLY